MLPETETTRPNFPAAFRRITPEEDFAARPGDFRCRWCDRFAEGRTASCKPSHLIDPIRSKHAEVVPARYSYGLAHGDDPENVVHLRRQKQKLSDLDTQAGGTFTRAAWAVYEQIEQDIKTSVASKDVRSSAHETNKVQISRLPLATDTDQQKITLTERKIQQLSSTVSFNPGQLVLLTDPIVQMEGDNDSDSAMIL
ncbi:hypothetical protein QFC24_006993 [Naganishia onofrii]|uniref:Uncharacterized protein n=1 Tax=Naganishia onofrii TaxID=1851511 RepID=A0ACC2WV70_9TREE|nr:hypothetical protein QFC24_006993 [Naganishia onofrii]